jgi:hypothetical protein
MGGECFFCNLPDIPTLIRDLNNEPSRRDAEIFHRSNLHRGLVVICVDENRSASFRGEREREIDGFDRMMYDYSAQGALFFFPWENMMDT